MTFPKKAKKLSEKEAYLKISSWCAYQERSHSEVRDRLYAIGAPKDAIDAIIYRLMQENFLNEERFARTYAGGKFRIKKWGKLKIIQGLKGKGISENCIRLALEEISQEDYLNTLQELIRKKREGLDNEKNSFVQKGKIADALVRKGFEPDLIWEVMKEYDV